MPEIIFFFLVLLKTLPALLSGLSPVERQTPSVDAHLQTREILYLYSGLRQPYYLFLLFGGNPGKASQTRSTVSLTIRVNR